MKKTSVLLIVIILISCEFNIDPELSDIVNLKKQIPPLTDRAQETDPSLALYRDPQTREMVAAFYTAVTKEEAAARSILKYAERNDISFPLAFSLAWAESRYKTRALGRNSNSVDRGLFQLNSNTFPFLKKEDFYNPEINARYGLSHLRFCLDEGKSEIVALAMYNAGTCGVRKGTPYSTLQHVANIMEYKEYLEDVFNEWIDEWIRDSVRIALR